MTAVAESAGDFTVVGGVLDTDYSYNGATHTLTILSDTALTVSGSTTTDTIVIPQGISVNLTFSDLNIDVSGITSACAFKIEDNSQGDVNITLTGSNSLKSGSTRAGLQKNCTGATFGILTIGGTGSLTVTGGSASAGIGGGSGYSTRDIIINGGTVTANGSNSGAGIGGGYTGSGINITIQDAVVEATGGINASGIGGGYFGNGENITIENSTVTAGSATNAAGIGGGHEGNGINITILSGTVIATGSSSGAGIGGGWKGDGSDITIEDGTVTAAGGIYAAGIGGGGDGDGSDITIIGGSVTAIGSPGYPGVGGGKNGSGSSIMLSPASGYQINVSVGSDEISASPLLGSPFSADTAYTSLLSYFHSSAELIGLISSDDYSYVIDFINETIDIDNGYEMNTAADFSGTDILDGQSITEYIGDTVYIRRAASGGNPAGDSENADIPDRPVAPPSLSASAISPYQITINEIANAQYRLQGESWQDGRIFSSLLPDTVYTFCARFKASNDSFASEQITEQISTLSATLSGSVTIPSSILTGQSVTANTTGLLPEGATFDYQWMLDGIDIPHENGGSYEVSASDYGKALSVVVTGSGDYTGSIESNSADIDENIAPTGEIWIGFCSNYWNEFLNNITFGLYTKDSLTITIIANDTGGSGIDTVEYYESSQALSLVQIQEVNAWQSYAAPFSIAPEDEKQLVYYAKFTDIAGNVTYISTDGIIFDTQSPVILTDYDKGDSSFEVTVTDVGWGMGFVSYTMSGGSDIDTVLANGKFTISNLADGRYDIVITAVDLIGNESSLTVNIVSLHSVTLPAGTGYAALAEVGSETPVEYGGSFSFTITMDSAYSNSDISVMSGDDILTPKNGVYTIGDIQTDQTITVEGVELNSPPPNTGYSPMPWLWGLLLTGSIALIVCLVVTLKKKAK